MGSVNLADSVLEDVTCRDGNPESDLQWDKQNESFTDYFERIKNQAESEPETPVGTEIVNDTDVVEIDEDQIDRLVEQLVERLESRIDRIIQKYSR